MNNKEVLEKAIQLAIDGGWRAPGVVDDKRVKIPHRAFARIWKWNSDYVCFRARADYEEHEDLHVPDIIYSHSFAKALWGDKFFNPVIRDDTGTTVGMIKQTPWKHHLRQMVVAPDPIKYLSENLPEAKDE